MFAKAKITEAKELELQDYKFNVSSYFDAMKVMEIKIYQKGPLAYSDEAFVPDLFSQLKDAPLSIPSEPVQIDGNEMVDG